MPHNKQNKNCPLCSFEPENGHAQGCKNIRENLKSMNHGIIFSPTPTNKEESWKGTMNEVDAEIFDFQMHVRKETGGNNRAVVDSTKLKQAILNLLLSRDRELVEKMKELATKNVDNPMYREVLSDIINLIQERK